MTDPYPQYQLRSEKAVIDGYPPLNNIGVVPAVHLPVDLVTDSDLTSHTAAADPHPGYQRESEKGVANGYPELDATGKIPSSQIPDSHWGWNSFASGFVATSVTALYTVPVGKAAKIAFLSIKNVTSTTQTVDVLIHRSGHSAVSVGTVELLEQEYAWYVEIGQEEWNLSSGDAIEASTSNSSSAAFVLLGALIDA